MEVFMSELEIKRIDTKVLLALCNILDSYEDFSEKVKELIQNTPSDFIRISLTTCVANTL